MELLDPRLLDWMAELGRWSVEGLWLPLLAWTVMALPAYLLVRFTDAGTPHVRYWTLVALLLALPIGVAAAALAVFDAPAMNAVAIVTLPAALTVTAPAAVPAAFAWTAWHTAGAALVTAWLVVLWRSGTLASGLFELRALRRSTDETPRWIVDEAVWIAYELELQERVAVIVASTPSPFTVGWLHPVIVLPRDLVERPKDLRFALTHELIHIRRNDFGLQFVEQIIGAMFYFHPLVPLIRRETSDLREITCDADVLSRTGERSAYARVLYRYSTTSTAEHLFAVGIFSRGHQLPKRIRAMQSYLSEHGLIRSKQKGVAVFALLLTLAVIAVACSEMLVEPAAETAVETSAPQEALSKEIFVVVEEMPELIGGLASIQENLEYPELAKKAGIEGRVIVQFVVDKEGNVVEPRVVRGIGSGLDAAALAAVRTARFKPGRQRGMPVRVKMSLPITFKLQKSSDASSASVIELRIDADNRLHVGGMPVRLSDLASALERSGLTSESIVSLQVDKDAVMSVVEDVQEILRSTDVRRIQYAAEPQEPQAVRSPLRIEQLRREDGIVRGRVVDPLGEPVPGVNVVLAGATVGGVTHPSGEFWFRLPPGHAQEGTVHASHVSYASTAVDFR